MKVHRAKKKALSTIRGDFAGQYLVLWDYLQEVQARNPNTTIKVGVEDDPNNHSSDSRVFQRVYICLGQLKSGFAAGKRDLLGLYGTFMKGPFSGIILTTVGLDGYNCSYPLAYGVVESENFSSWTWFLKNLGDDLDMDRRSNFTFVSDRQKGLKRVIETLFPAAEHRYCLRHIHENMKKHWRGKEFKDCIWKCATATTVPQFTHAMEELRQLNSATYEWLKAIHPKHWSRSHFTGRAHCDVLLNNMCESFNSKLVKGRDKPTITCLEFIREYIMRKLVTVQKTIDKCKGPLTPTATKTLEKIKIEADDCRVVYCGNNKYQVTGIGMDQCMVDVTQQTCSCNKWELTGMPCKHAIAAIWDMRQNSEEVGVPETWVHPVYWLQTWKDIYAFKLEPINGRSMWEKNPCPTKLLPSTHTVPIGRPKKKRRRAAIEDDGSTGIRRLKCSKCGNVGHNGRSCKGQSTGTTSGSARGGKSSRKGKPSSKRGDGNVNQDEMDDLSKYAVDEDVFEEEHADYNKEVKNDIKYRMIKTKILDLKESKYTDEEIMEYLELTPEEYNEHGGVEKRKVQKGKKVQVNIPEVGGKRKNGSERILKMKLRNPKHGKDGRGKTADYPFGVDEYGMHDNVNF